MTPQRHKNIYKLAPAQEGMFRHLEANNSGTPVEQIICSLDEPIEPTTLKSAWRRITERHDALRTSFHFDDSPEPFQCVQRETGLSWKYRDVSGLTADQQETELNQWLMEDGETGFELDHAPLFRLNLFRLADKKWCLVWTIQHGILDGRSFSIVLSEVFRSYDAERRREALDLPAVQRYSDYLNFLGQLNLSHAERYWRETLEGFTRPTSLAALEGPSGETGQGEGRIQLSGKASRALSELAARERFTVNNAVEAAWAVALSRYNGSSDVVFGTTRPCRGFQPRAGSMVGTFVNTVPVRVKMTNELSVLELLRQMRANEIALREYEHTPLSLIQSWSDLSSSNSLFESAVVFNHAPLDSQMKSPYLNWTNRKVHRREYSNFPLTLSAFAEPELDLRLAYDRKRFRQSHIEQVLGHLQTILEEIAAGKDKTVGDFSIQIERERHVEPIAIASSACVTSACVASEISEPRGLASRLGDRAFTVTAANDAAVSSPRRAISAIPVPRAYESPRVSDRVLSPVMVASGLVPVAASPLTPLSAVVEEESILEADLDVQEIPATEIYSADNVQDDAAGELQAVLAEIWCSGLGQSSSAAREDSGKFSSHSLKATAVRWLQSIRDRFETRQQFTTLSTEPETPAESVPVPVDMMEEAPAEAAPLPVETVEEPLVITPALSIPAISIPRTEEPADCEDLSDSAVFTIQPNGTKPPIFCVGALEGESTLFRTLAAELGTEQPMYGVDPTAITNDERVLSDVKKLARRCIAELRATGHQQPYCLVGHSFGGLVAYEIAQQLEQNGIEVPALVLIDTHYQAGCRSQETIADRVHRYQHQWRNHRRGGNVSAGVSAQQRASDRYRARPYSGRACILKASAPRPFLDGGSKIGWGKLINDTISIYFEIPGDNGTINTAKHAPLIARRLREFLGGVEDHRVEQVLSRKAS